MGGFYNYNCKVETIESGKFMNDNEIIKAIATNLSGKRNLAALNNYEVLYHNINYVNELLIDFKNNIVELQAEIEKNIKVIEALNDEFKDDSNSKFYFRDIVPRIILNDIAILERFYTVAKGDERHEIGIDNIQLLKKGFIDYSELVTVTRQTLDSLVSDAYQLSQLDVKEINFHVLTSLKSFSLYATKSLYHALFNEELINALDVFDKLNYDQRVRGRESDITKCIKKTFGEKIEFIFNKFNLVNETILLENLKNLFKFSSEFTHIGYISTFYSSNNYSDIVFGSDIGPYLSSTENFNELKYEIIETMIRFLIKVYLVSISDAIKHIFCDSKDISESIKFYIKTIESYLNSRNNEYYFFIIQGLQDSNKVIELPCMCGQTTHWEAPHELSKLYCKYCGSKFKLIEIEGDPGYIMTSLGPVKVIGSSRPDIESLPEEERLKLFEMWEKWIDKKELVKNEKK